MRLGEMSGVIILKKKYVNSNYMYITVVLVLLMCITPLETSGKQDWIVFCW